MWGLRTPAGYGTSRGSPCGTALKGQTKKAETGHLKSVPQNSTNRKRCVLHNANSRQLKNYGTTNVSLFIFDNQNKYLWIPSKR